ncbi:MAG: hypothetical protein JNM21_14220 [Taibaiella sp.]|nr:hypothetical protein [Taibaiella sp.]
MHTGLVFAVYNTGTWVMKNSKEDVTAPVTAATIGDPTTLKPVKIKAYR